MCFAPQVHRRKYLCNAMTSACWSHGASSSCWYALIMQPGPMQRNTHRRAHASAKKGRADIWYMRAMINRLIRNGLIKFTLHIKNWIHTWQHLRCPVPECVRDWLRVCSSLSAFQPFSGGPSIYLARLWWELFSYLIAERQSGRLKLDCLSPVPKELRQQASERRSSLKKKKKRWHPIPLCQSNWLLVKSARSPELLCLANVLLTRCCAGRLRG